MCALLCLDRRIVGEEGRVVFMLNLTIDVVIGNLDYQGEHHHYADQVGDHHQAVEGVGQIPRQGGGHNRTEHNGGDVDDLENKGSLGTEQILPSLGAVVGPAQHGGEGEEEHSDGDEFLTDIAPGEYLIEGAGYQGSIGIAFQDGTGFQIVRTGGALPV